MKGETMKDVHAENPRVPAYEIVLRCKNLVVEADEEDSDENRNDGKTKCGGQLEKQTKQGRKESDSEEEKENIELVNLTTELKQKCVIFDECHPDIISRSPMRTQECSHYYKPYCKPGHSVSRTFEGVTRVVEGDLYSIAQSLFENSDVGLRDVEQWTSRAKTDPNFLQEFVMSFKDELYRGENPNIYEYRSSRNECSNASSQFTSPDQSPSEQNLTSPESVVCEDNSLYSKSPNIVPLDSINISLMDDEEKSPSTSNGKVSLRPTNVFNIPGSGEGNQGPSDPTSNIGTVMRNLVEDPFESPIDLNQFATVCEVQGDGGQRVSTTERDALNEKLDPKTKEIAWTRISQINLDSLGIGDKDGDTQLMILLVSETKKILEYVYVIVERLLKEKPEYLSLRNELSQDALYLASFKLLWEPLVASYIAEAMVRGKQDVNMKYEDGNTLLHCLAKQGDSHVKVLERLVKLRYVNKTPVFDINKKNNGGFTPLHIACEVHKTEGLHTYQTVKVLMENGADCTAKDYKDENTPIHVLINESCDVELLSILLENVNKFGVSDGSPPTTVPNRQGNTALHLACGRNTLELAQQKHAIGLLLRHGAMIKLKNINGCVPSVLVDSSRKQDIKTILHSYRQK